MRQSPITIRVELDELGVATITNATGKREFLSDQAQIAQAFVESLGTASNQAEIDAIVDEASLRGITLIVEGPKP